MGVNQCKYKSALYLSQRGNHSVILNEHSEIVKPKLIQKEKKGTPCMKMGCPSFLSVVFRVSSL